MADAKITDLTADTLPASTDVIPMVDLTGPTTKKVTFGNAVGVTAVSSAFTTSSTSLTNITGLSVPLTTGTWVFEINISGSAATGANGAQFGVQYSGSTTSINAEQIGQTNTTTWAATARITAFNTASTTVMTTSAAQCHVRIFGQVVVSGAGNLTAQGLKVTSQTLTVDASSWMWAFKVA